MILLLTFVAVFLNRYLASSDSLYVCKDTKYDIITHTCCNGTVHSRSGGMEDCCNTSSDSLYVCKDTKYDIITHTCCNGTVHSRSGGMEDCCNNVLYKTETHECDNGVLRAKGQQYTTPGNNLVCGDELYDTSEKMCCNSTVYPKSVQRRCCNGVLFNTSTHKCCGSNVWPKSALNETVTCCGSYPYNQEKSVCCENVLYNNKNPAYYGCCKTKLMARGDMCCGSKVHKQSNLTCCGNETFDQQVQWCEENKEILGLSEIRCGNIIYNREEKMCCEETVNPGTKDFLCCGSKSYNRTVRDCSQGNIVKKGNLWHPSCGEYNPNTHDCCQGRLMKKNGTHWYCCNRTMINYDVDNCCGAGKIFNKRNQRCCGGNVIAFEDKCCNGQRIDSKTELCCGRTRYTDEEIIQKEEPFHDQCCPNMAGGRSYNSVKFDCLPNDRVVKKQPRRHLCGRKKYNDTTDLCCKNRFFKGAIRRNMKCCLPSARAYNPKIQACRLGKLKIRKQCPTKCETHGRMLREFCQNNHLAKTKKISKKFLRRLSKGRGPKSCQCVYRKRKRLVGISFQRKNRLVLNYFPGQKRFVKKHCTMH
ncbi:uncharacterized protein LOC125650107 isoform X1 [Ostrea edulis]|uniref:uncharacterized protein LOC125650107 isoform X1 n=1 Tax=Ostrea edulis TaxID=37623 RepID=UPI0024AE8BB7|nr:uncharacterized protein LOC125650107 isoform X1 [Ostrea edulis]